MKKNILVAALIACMATASVIPALAAEGAVSSYGGSTTTVEESNGHWVANRDGSWSFVSNENGAPIYGWIVSQHQWYYIGANGRMVTGWQKINFDTYYFAQAPAENQPLGSLYMNKLTPDGYRVDSNGVWIR